MPIFAFNFAFRSPRPVRRRISRVGGLFAVAGAYLIALALGGLPAIASAQLLGGSSVAPAMDTDAPGLAEAFKVTASATEAVDTLNVYIEASSRATKVTVGLYSNYNGHPARLLAQGSVANPVAGTWNKVSVTPTQVTSGVSYWLALLGTGGTLGFRDNCCGGGSPSENSAQTTLTSLPGTWSSGARWSDGLASLYGSSSSAPPPTPPGQIATGTATLSWMPPTTNSNGSVLSNLAGYKIHYGTSSTNLNQTAQVANPGLTSYVLNNLAGGATWYFGITAYTTTGVESALSSIVSKTIQ